MKFNRLKLRHFYLNKYLLSLFKEKKYYMSYDYKHKALWYRTYKVGSRTIDNKLKSNNPKYIYGSLMSYSPGMFKDFFKFSFVRNPEGRFISAWKDKVLKQNYFKFDAAEHEKMKDLNYFLSWVEKMDIDNCDEHLKSQNSLIDLNNIDFLGRFENFSEDFAFVMNKLNIKLDSDIEHRNKGLKVSFTPTEEQRRRIYKIYYKDFQLFYPNHKNSLGLKPKNEQVQKHRAEQLISH
ncbi:sulfotransferase family 2 domain-containing protein [Croceimicrobium hydrocarbonivorans]|uniref:Sulfotransferase family 2 domain-containing protein n=1 Tax=Croceimicrobium hydrocarbonivorans TaxID=2761580 RepID=A0A7H0VHJ0_9FLAO|nr:sulfotransferase family 2 domain-containing protein [Croceimicrobium hydrocarbonivorans]QNR25188.1 sulfotransferase family 2 domain-containing protein [Croceimicrobium hydrocarbonivorans]